MLLIAQGREPAQVAAYRRMGAFGSPITICETLAEARRLFDGGRAATFLLRYSDEVPALLKDIDPEAAGRIILIFEPPIDPTALASLPQTVGAILIVPRPPRGDELLLALAKHSLADFFGLEKHLAWGTAIHELPLTDSLRRGEAIDELDRYFGPLGFEPRLVGQMLTVADELITNAFYNAPVKDGRRLHSHRSRLDAVETERIDVRYGCDGNRLGVAVRDRYGSLEPSTVLSHIGRAFAPAAASSGGGAGLGLSTSFRAASQLIFNISPGSATEAIGVVEGGNGYRHFIELGRSCQLYHRPIVRSV